MPLCIKVRLQASQETLHYRYDQSHNRSVITRIGGGTAIVKALRQAVESNGISFTTRTSEAARWTLLSHLIRFPQSLSEDIRIKVHDDFSSLFGRIETLVGDINGLTQGVEVSLGIRPDPSQENPFPQAYQFFKDTAEKVYVASGPYLL